MTEQTMSSPGDGSASHGHGLAVRAHSIEKRFGWGFARGRLPGGSAAEGLALDGLALNVPEGGVYALVGSNGAGKTTALPVLMGLVRPDAGEVTVLGLDGLREAAAVRARTGYVPERRDFGYDWMKVAMLLEHHLRYMVGWDAAYAQRLVNALEISVDRRYGALSKGQARRVQLVMALAWRPPLLLLDEPTDGLDPVMRDRLLSLLAGHLEASPTTVMISTHVIHEIERLADHVGVLRKGRLTTEVDVASLERMLRRYRLEAPEASGNGSPSLAPPLRVVRCERRGREVELTAWGDEVDVTKQLLSAGYRVGDVRGLRLADATLALLMEGADLRTASAAGAVPPADGHAPTDTNSSMGVAS